MDSILIIPTIFLETIVREAQTDAQKDALEALKGILTIYTAEQLLQQDPTLRYITIAHDSTKPFYVARREEYLAMVLSFYDLALEKGTKEEEDKLPGKCTFMSDISKHMLAVQSNAIELWLIRQTKINETTL